jgi:tetratricopeptide (TPR) repeat protein
MEKSSRNSERSSEADNILCLAEELREKSQYRQSLNLFKKGLAEYAKTHDREGTYQCLLALGGLYRMVGNFDLASENYTEAIDLARKAKSRIEVADAKTGLGLSLRAQGKWKKAIKLIGESQKIYEREYDSHGIAFTLWAKAGALRIKGDIIEAIKTFKESYEVFKSMKDSPGTGYCLCGIGGASRIAGRFSDSLKFYTAANRLFSSIKDTFGRAYSYCGIGNAYRMLGDYGNAFAYFSRAARLYKKMGDKVSYAYTLWGLGTAYKMTGDYKKARNSFTNAKHFFKRTKDPRGLIYCDLGFGEVALIEGKNSIAKKYLLKALEGSKDYGFAVEECYARTAYSFTNSTRHHRSKEEKGGSPGKHDNTCYERLGLRLGFQALPLNIP